MVLPTNLKSYLICGAICFVLGVTGAVLTHKYWCSCHTSPKSDTTAFQVYAPEIQGQALNQQDKEVLRISRRKDTAVVVIQQPVSNGNVSESHDSYKVDTSIWGLHTSGTKTDSVLYHFKHFSDCTNQRDVNLFIESSSPEPPASSEGRQPFISEGTIQALHQLSSFIRLSAFLEHDFARGSNTIGVRANVDIWKIGLYGSAAIGAQNLPVGVDYVFWKK